MHARAPLLEEEVDGYRFARLIPAKTAGAPETPQASRTSTLWSGTSIAPTAQTVRFGFPADRAKLCSA